MLYSCTQMATVGVKGLKSCVQSLAFSVCLSLSLSLSLWDGMDRSCCYCSCHGASFAHLSYLCCEMNLDSFVLLITHYMTHLSQVEAISSAVAARPAKRFASFENLFYCLYTKRDSWQP